MTQIANLYGNNYILIPVVLGVQWLLFGLVFHLDLSLLVAPLIQTALLDPSQITTPTIN